MAPSIFARALTVNKVKLIYLSSQGVGPIFDSSSDCFAREVGLHLNGTNTVSSTGQENDNGETSSPSLEGTAKISIKSIHPFILKHTRLFTTKLFLLPTTL